MHKRNKNNNIWHRSNTVIKKEKGYNFTAKYTGCTTKIYYKNNNKRRKIIFDMSLYI